MIALEHVRDGIGRLGELSEEALVKSGIEEIFFGLMYADQPFYAAFIQSCPLLTPPPNDDGHLYLRIFSHKEVADMYALNNPESEIQEISMLELLQLGRWAIAQGGYGYLLNEGDTWIVISIPNYLRLFFSRIYEDSNLYSQNCVDILLFLAELRRNSLFQYYAVWDEGDKWTGYIQPESKPSETCLPISIQSLFLVPSKNITVLTSRGEFTAAKELLLGGLAFCGYAQETGAPMFAAECFDEPPLSGTNTPDDWHYSDVSELALSFPPIVLPDNNEQEESVPTQTPQLNALKLPDVSLVLIAKERLKKCMAWGKTLFKPKQHEPQEEVLTQAGEDPSPSNTLKPSITTKFPKLDASVKKKAFFISIASLFLSLVIGVVIVHHYQYKVALEEFYSYISNREYGNAYTLYQEREFGPDANDILGKHLDSLILKYANNEIGAEELSASMQAISNFIAMQQNLEIARLTAAKLESSKNAYVEGKESEDLFTQLDLWRQVLTLDTVNYAAVQQSVRDNETVNTQHLNDDILYYSTRARDFAKARYEVLAYWYPDNEITIEWAPQYTSDQSSALSFYPVYISNITIHQQTNSYWSLHIDWTNTSAKTITQIIFSVVALNESGEYVRNADNQGTWTIFDARDQGRYTPGASSPAENYNWYGVFYGPYVAKVKLTGVNIVYADGSTASYTDEVHLRNIMIR